MKKYYLYLIMVVIVMMSCQKQNAVFEESPAQRNAQNITNLRKELVEAPYGWRVQYFPKTDSLLYSNRSATYNGVYEFSEDFTTGGFYFLMKFHDKGVVEMVSDDGSELRSSKQSEFEVKQNTFVQLSFTTTTYLHNLINNTFEGTSDFFFVRKDFNGNLWFKKLNSIEPARDYIIFERLSANTDWANDVSVSNNAERARDNRYYFEGMSNPKLTIRIGSKEYFRSNETTRNTYKRYHLFKYNQNPNEYSATNFRINVLGSGYVGTERGLSFRTGIRFSNTIIFYDFERKEDYFVSELVRVYDKMRKQYVYMAKHLAETYGHEYEDLFYRAEIRN